MTTKVLTLAFPVVDGKILLGLKKRGFGAGLYNGFGGKLDNDETVEAGMQRELNEEVGIEAVSYKKIGLLNFHYIDNEMQVHVFKVGEFNGAPEESEEMTAEWFQVEDIPFSKMWPDDEYWFPLFIEEKPFVGDFWFGEEKDELGRLKILKSDIRPLQTCHFA